MKIFSTITLIMALTILSQTKKNYPKSFVDYNAFETLVKEVKKHRNQHLLSLKQFQDLNSKSDFVILDTRSKEMYDSKHIKGAIHLNFSDFNQISLQELIPNLNTKILIYCNNNIKDDSLYFMTKTIIPAIAKTDTKELTLALNIPTFINLYGYGYRNVYELDELISISDKRIKFEGSAVLKTN